MLIGLMCTALGHAEGYEHKHRLELLVYAERHP